MYNIRSCEIIFSEKILVLSFVTFCLIFFFQLNLFGVLTLAQTTNLGCSKWRKFADDKFKFDENGSELFKRVKKHCGKREIARYEQLLLFLQCFQKICTTDT